MHLNINTKIIYMLYNTINNFDITFHYSKYSCIREFYFIHVVFCYLVFITGIACFITRLNDKLKPAHEYLGRFYILSMLYATASSLLIHNSGLPEAVLISFVYVIGGLSIAWLLILIHKVLLNNSIKKLKQEGNTRPYETINKSKNCIKRAFSLKSFHGILMFLSWFNITGRIFASDQSGDFTCYTYPVYKPINKSNILVPLPAFDPNYSRLPWANREVFWALITFLGPLGLGLLVSIIWSVIYTKINKLKFF